MPGLSGEVLAIISALLAHLVAIGVLYWRFRHDVRAQNRQAKLQRRNQWLARRIDVSHERLAQFYGPLRMFLLRTQHDYQCMIELVRSGRIEDARSILESRLLPLNRSVATVISENIHLLHPHDDERLYDQFVRHVESLELQIGLTLGETPKVEFPQKLHRRVEDFYDIVAREAAVDLLVPEE